MSVSVSPGRKHVPHNEYIHIGTSGWSYKGWIGPFYPEGIKQKGMLPTYSDVFKTVEVNTSFYHLPARKTVENWVEQTPDDFIFACKASRYITHMKKLKDPEQSLGKFFDVIKAFGKKLGPILFQLPPGWNLNRERLEKFIDALPQGYRYTFEFRNQSWLTDEVYQLLKKNNLALCFYDLKEFRSPEIPTADFIYIRLHGPQKEAYTGSYGGRTLAGYAKKFTRWHSESKEIFCYFDNDQKAYAPHDAQKLMHNIEKQL